MFHIIEKAMNSDEPLRHINTLAIDDGTQSSSKQGQAGLLGTPAACDAVGMHGKVRHLFPNQP